MLDEKKWVYAGSFDLFHDGHLKTAEHMIQSWEVEKLIIWIGNNPEKANSFLFHHHERATMIKDALLDLPEDIAAKISVDFVQWLLVDYCQKRWIKYILKTYRNPADFREESAQAYYNTIINPEVETKLIEANFENSLPHVSSSGEKVLTKLKANTVWKHETLRVKHALETRINQQYIVGMTWEMWSGKSYVGEKFVQVGEKFGIPTHNIDFDKLWHNILIKSDNYQHVRNEIKATFWDQCMCPDGSIHRWNLGSIVFANPDKLQQLNVIMKQSLNTELRDTLDKKKWLIIINSALLADHEMGNIVNNNIVSININRLEQIKRLLWRENSPENLAKRDGKESTAEDIEKRFDTQLSTQLKEAYFFQQQRLKRFWKTIQFNNTQPSEEDFTKSYLETLDAVDSDLSLRFTSIYNKLGLTWNAQQLFRDIYFRYLDNNLPYHNWEHIKAGINMIYYHRDDLDNPELVAMARFFHDIIYTIGEKNNELLSAKLAQSILESHGMTEHNTRTIRNLISATEHKNSGNYTMDQQYLMDIDMSILASDPATYDRYAQSIRIEYSQYPDDIYIPGRIDVLQKFLQKPIFHTADFAQLESIARTNIEREISILQAKSQK